MSETIQHNESHTPVAEHSRLSFTPRFDIWENENEFVLVGDLPGVDSQDLDLQFEKQELRIHGKVKPRQGKVNFLQEEYGVGDFYRTFNTGENVDGTAIAAQFTAGVLTVRLPKRAETRPRRIEVQAG